MKYSLSCLIAILSAGVACAHWCPFLLLCCVVITSVVGIGVCVCVHVHACAHSHVYRVARTEGASTKYQQIPATSIDILENCI